MAKRKKAVEQESLSIYVFFLTALAIFVNVLRGISIDIDLYSVSLCVFLYPVVFYVLNMIIKKFGYHKGLEAMFISAGVMILFMIISGFIFHKEITIMTYLGFVVSYISSCFIDLIIYYYLFMNTVVPKIALFTNYLFVVMINEIVYLTFTLNGVLANDFWMVFVLEVGIQSIIAFILTIYDHSKELYSK